MDNFTTVSQTNLLKMDRVQNKSIWMSHTGNPQGHTHWDHAVHARSSTDVSQTETEKVEQVKAFFNAVKKSAQTTPWSHERHKRMPTGTGQVLDGSGRGIGTADMLADRAQANQGKCVRCCWEWPADKMDSEIKLLIQQNSKLQDLVVYTDSSVTKDQSEWASLSSWWSESRDTKLLILGHVSLMSGGLK